jgi:hypothetical protein
VNFILLHGKAGATQDDYLKREAACLELKDTLDAFFSTASTYIIGDFNDALHTSIYTGTTFSSYYALVSDSTDSDHYKSVTLPLGVAGQSSMINFPNVIDNHVISNELTPIYIPGSAQIKTDVTSVVPDYVSAHNTSDHYPVFSKYNLAGVITGLPNVTPTELGIKVGPNPFLKELFLAANKTLNGLQVKLIHGNGQVVFQMKYGRLLAGQVIKPVLPVIPPGVYYLQLETPHHRAGIKLLHF